MIYLACPYSSSYPELKEWRYEMISEITVELIHRGYNVFSPIAYSHPLATKFNLNGDWEFWRKLDLAFLDICTMMVVVAFDGWSHSKGVSDEMKHAIDTGKPIVLFNPTYECSENLARKIKETEPK